MLANPAENASEYSQSLERLVNDYPQSGLLQMLLASAGEKQHLSRAAAYCNPRVLHKLLYNPDDLAIVTPDKIVSRSDTGNHENYFSIPVNEADILTEASSKLSPVSQEPLQDVEVDAVSDSPENEGPVADLSDPQYLAGANATEDNEQQQPHGETFTFPEEREIEENHGAKQPEYTEQPIQAGEASSEEYNSSAIEEGNTATGNDQTVTPANYTQYEEVYFRQDIDDEIYDEIVSIEDIGFQAVSSAKASESREVEEKHLPELQEEISAAAEEAAPQPENSLHAQEEKLILGNIVGSDYLLFDKKLDELRGTASSEEKAGNEPVAFDRQLEEPANESKDLSRYNDDKMPYSFMWWLDKTRKEHAVSLQPYATEALQKGAVTLSIGAPAAQHGSAPQAVTEKRSTADELQQQYYENIFSLTSVSGIEAAADLKNVEFDHNKKEDVIIERFIYNEPQIKPLAADKLDNENKAKKSSEDKDELVTETLARIYTDQMLYHKAIATYQKLILKFPEKKLYFAAQIEQLEKRTN